jgi:hypothetical protein
MLQKGGNPRAVGFNVGDYCGEFVQVVSDQFNGLPLFCGEKAAGVLPVDPAKEPRK